MAKTKKTFPRSPRSTLSSLANAPTPGRHHSKGSETQYESGYTFVVKTPDGGPYRFVYRDGDYLNHAYYPRMIFPAITQEIRTFWRRAVIEGLYQWDCSVDPTSMRLVRFETRLTDLTFFDAKDRSSNLRALALAKLTAEEAKAIGREKEWFGAMMMRKERSQQRERDLFNEITSDAGVWAIEDFD